jgi:uncharacterized protein with PQ loop repeat
MSRQHYSLHFHLSKKKQKSLLDKIVLLASFLYPLTGIPQVLLVFEDGSEGVSLASWVGFACFSLLFFVYGCVHKIKPMIVTNALWLIVDWLVVFGVVAHRMAS